MNDPVNHPAHYTQGDIECIDAIEASMTPEEFAGFLKGTAFAYIWRFEKKWNPKEDLDKADFYLDRLRQHISKHPDLFSKTDINVDVKLKDLPEGLQNLAKQLEGTPNEIRA